MWYPSPTAVDQAPRSRAAFDQAYAAGGEWWRGVDNADGHIAWGESMIMAALAAMYRGTGEPTYLDELAQRADAVLLQRDSIRGVTDYADASHSAWQALKYSDNREPLCWAVHTGLICWPMLELARLVDRDGLESVATSDDSTLGAKSTAYVAAAELAVAVHDPEWAPAGYYRQPAAADFTLYTPGNALPLNQCNALGRTLAILGELTGTASYTTKATALADRFDGAITSEGDAIAWCYRTACDATGYEDVGHAALNAWFILECARLSITFDGNDTDALEQTFRDLIIVPDADGLSVYDYLDGDGDGGIDGDGLVYIGRWGALAPGRPQTYVRLRRLLAHHYPPTEIDTTSHPALLGWAHLAEYEGGADT